MNILIVSQYFWPENFRINDLAVGLVERGHNVSVLSGIPNYPDGKFFKGYGLLRNWRQEYKGIQIIRVPLFPRGNGSGIRLAINYLSYAFFASFLGPFLYREKFDLIFVYQLSPATMGLPAIVLKKLKSIPILFWIQDIWPQSLSATGAISSELILNSVGKMVRFIYRRCDRILIQSSAFLSEIESQGVNPDRITYLPNSVEETYKPVFGRSMKQSVAAIPSGFRVMFAGNIGAAQDFQTILSAAETLKKYNDIHWVILGDGRKFTWVTEQVKVLGLSDCVHLLGRHPVEAMADFFSAADVMLVTLKRDPIFALTIPAKVQSYMACGKPIVAAIDGEGGRIVVESGAGLASPAENSDALAQSILKMYNMSEDERKKMGNCGKTYCDEHFEREMLIDRLESWMEKCIANFRKNVSEKE